MTRTARRLKQDMAGIATIHRTRKVEIARSLALSIPAVVKARNLEPLDDRMKRIGESYLLSVEGVNLCLPADCFGAAREMYARRVYLASPLVQLPTNGWVLDCGANQGLFALLAVGAGCKALAIEAQSGFTPRRRELLALNEMPVDSMIHVEAMLGGTSGQFTSDEEWKASSHGGSAERPMTASISGLLSEHSIDEVAFLKMDIEGGDRKSVV